MKPSRLVFAMVAAALLVSLSVGATLAGEITGNGKVLEVKGQSACAFSGQEDLQWFFDDHQTDRKPEPTRGDPAHAQSWGQIPKEFRDFLTTIGLHPGTACNPTRADH